MSQFDHRLFIYISLETTNRDRFVLFRCLEIPTLKELIERAKVSIQLIEIGLKSLAWGLAGNLGGKPWREIRGAR